ncbi:fk506-binding protein, putative [Entamoeba dispar SAW760]|uniref:peptidylprolyl isomerase n=1 Tax=Entamoeba dispar (strain ATCC PRA-260 / SAW760) TaxID=370354 RepID=B0EQC0_ENTDS|nr:fk506-binding protein, putative [Entamoeba dispar SAW760]EDR23275.1 fk506-binding protein, putative [Entamoeba dispar SAW760]|eukprot:EDR23275.1 fk506-binding protein, putative [Entamoeba dispar SAW760]
MVEIQCIEESKGQVISDRMEIKIQYSIQSNLTKEENEIQFVIGEGSVLPFIENFVINKRIGEKYQIITKGKEIFGEEGFGERIKSEEEVKIIIKILEGKEIKKPKAFEECIKEIIKTKEKGKEKITKKEYKEAIKIYQECAAELHNLIDDINYQKYNEEIKKQLLLIHSNMALCWLKLENWNETKQQSEEVLKFDPVNVKALYRIGVVLNKKEQYSLALNYLKKAMTLAEQDGLIRKEYNFAANNINKITKK